MATRPFTRITRRKPKYHRNAQWRRDRRPRPSMASVEAALAILPSLPRPMLCRLTERLIERLDEIDGDPDLEPESDRDDAHDDGCGVVIINGAKHWGSEHDEPIGKRPRYGVNQARGPLNSKW